MDASTVTAPTSEDIFPHTCFPFGCGSPLSEGSTRSLTLKHERKPQRFPLIAALRAAAHLPPLNGLSEKSLLATSVPTATHGVGRSKSGLLATNVSAKIRRWTGGELSGVSTRLTPPRTICRTTSPASSGAKPTFARSKPSSARSAWSPSSGLAAPARPAWPQKSPGQAHVSGPTACGGSSSPRPQMRDRKSVV